MSGEKNQVLENMKTRRSIRKYKPYSGSVVKTKI